MSADSLLNIPAYWAGERTFQLLTQAAGRAGRGDIPGRVIMQTYAPDHYVIQCAARQDYRAFYDQEVQFRKELGYPPFQEMAKILVQDESEEQVWRKANDVAAALNSWNQDHGDEVAVIGPYEDVIKKIRNKYRVVLSLTGKDLTAIKKPCSTFRPAGRPVSSSTSTPCNHGDLALHNGRGSHVASPSGI